MPPERRTIPTNRERREIVKRLLILINSIQSTPDNYRFRSYFTRFRKRLEYKPFTSKLLFDRTGIEFKTEDYSRVYTRVLEQLQESLPGGNRRQYAQFMLSLPIVVYDFKRFLNQETSAHGQNNTFTRELDIVADPKFITRITQEEIRGWLTKLFNSNDSNPNSLAGILETEFEQADDSEESTVTDKFSKVLNPICSFLNLRRKPQYRLKAADSPLVPKVYNQDDFLTADLALYIRGDNDGDIEKDEDDEDDYVDKNIHNAGKKTDIYHIKAIIEYKALPIFHGRASRLNIPNLVKKEGSRFARIIKQVESNMIAARVRHGAICDSQYLVLLLFDDTNMNDWEVQEIPKTLTIEGGTIANERGQRQPGVPLEIPLKLRVLDKYSQSPTMLEALAGFLYSAKTDTSAEEFFQRLPTPLVLKNQPKTHEEKDKDIDESRDRKGKHHDSGGSSNKPPAQFLNMDTYVIDTSNTILFPSLGKNSGFGSANLHRPVSAGSSWSASANLHRPVSANLHRPASAGSSWSASSSSVRPNSSGSEFSADTTATSFELSDRKLPMIELNFNEDDITLKHSKSIFAQIFVVKAVRLRRFILDSVRDDELIVMKLYDPKYPIDILKKFDYDEGCITARYDLEMQCIEVLREVRNFNSPYLNHRELIVRYYRGLGKPFTGKVILSRYIPQAKFPYRNLDTYNQAKKQLSLIHQASIIHNDLKEDNILIESGTNKVYLIDFNAAKFINDVVGSDEEAYFSKLQHNLFVKTNKANEEFKGEENQLKFIFNLDD